MPQIRLEDLALDQQLFSQKNLPENALEMLMSESSGEDYTK